MELYASGFNAWNQLCFDSTVSDGDTEPKDLSSFTCVLEDALIERPDARQSFTIGEGAFTSVVPIPHLSALSSSYRPVAYSESTTVATIVVPPT